MVLARAVLAAIPTVQKEVKEVEANLIQKRDTAIIPIKNPKAVEASPTHMGKAAMATRKHQPTEGMEDIVQVLSNT